MRRKKTKTLLTTMLSLVTTVNTFLPLPSDGHNNISKYNFDSNNEEKIIYAKEDFNESLNMFNDYSSYIAGKQEETDKFVRQKYLSKPRLVSNNAIKNKIDSLYDKINVPSYFTKDLFYNSVRIESAYGKNNCNAHAKSPVGANGLMQMFPAAWRDVDNKTDYDKMVFDPDKNLENGLKYWIWTSNTLKKMNPDWKNLSSHDKVSQMVASYNWGIGKLKDNDWKFPENNEETSNYRKKMFNKQIY